MAPMTRLAHTLTLIAALGSGLVAGVLFAFSTSVLPGLRTLSAEHGIRAMQRLDTAITNPVFLTLFTGTALLSVASAVVALRRWSRPGAAFLLAGGLLYLTTVAITRVVHLPRNATLQQTNPTGQHAASWWADYATTWTTWNHARTLTAFVAAVAFTVALTRTCWPSTSDQRPTATRFDLR
jgi:uncharacterized membrane protein